MSFVAAVSKLPSRRIFLAGVSLLALTGPSLAADLPLRAPPAATAASWAGFYLGVHGGYGWKHDEFRTRANQITLDPVFIDGIKSTGAVFGAHAGYNWQFNRLVTGLELDFSAANIKGSNGLNESAVIPPFGAVSASLTLSENVKYLGTARARLGWQPVDNVLLYGTAGLAWERLDLAQNITLSVPPTTQTQAQRVALDKFGWVAGAGVEVMLGGPNWIGRVEYLHYDLGKVQLARSFVAGGVADIDTAGSQTIDLVRAGISYKFGEPARFAGAAKADAKSPITPLPSSSWAGFYLGAHGGYGWGNDPFSLPVALAGGTNPGAIEGMKSQGWVAGGHVGHNWQYNRFVTGFEFDLSAADIEGGTNAVEIVPAPNLQTASLDERVKYLGTVRGRLGWTPMETVLLYGTAGLAWERLELSQTTTLVGPTGTANLGVTQPSDRFGWVAGFGGEAKLGNSNWIGRLEYLHYDFGRVIPEVSQALVAPGVNIAATSTAGHQTIDLVRAGVSYKFGPEFAAAAAPAMFGKAPRLAPPPQGWAGFYLGVHAGHGWYDNNFSTVVAAPDFIGGISSKGWLGGGQAGVNWQIAKVVAGLEVDGTATGLKGSSLPVLSVPFTVTFSDDVKYLGTARGRLGWTPSASWLLYGTGGLAWERVHRTSFSTTGAASSFSIEQPQDRFGWAAGGGVETMIGASNWIARLEYLHYDFGTVETTQRVASTIPGQVSFTDRGGRQTIDTLRAGVSYKFTP